MTVRPDGADQPMITEDLLVEDHHVHSAFSDDATSTIAENLTAARERGLRTICITDHVRADTQGVAAHVAEVRSAAEEADLTVLCGVEVKILDAYGRLDLPADLPPLDLVLIADHQYPGPDGPIAPGVVRQRLEQGELNPAQVADTLVTATARALLRTDRGQIAHLFSLMPKVGLNEDTIGIDRVRFLAAAAKAAGAVVEANEKWACPGPSVLAEFRAAGVPIVASSDSHRAADVGRYERVPRLLAEASRR